MSGRTIQARGLGQALAVGVGTVMSGVPVRWGAQIVREQLPQLPDLTPARGTPRPGRHFSPCLRFLLGLEPGPDVSRPKDHCPKAEPPSVVREPQESWSRWEVGWKPQSEPRLHAQCEHRAARSSCLSWNLTENGDSSRVGPVGSTVDLVDPVSSE